mmetsp:Transcript_93685/g.169221  ORF Transcript_93685/g.169221 Transcript_93685/m.169221 type:complete len:692 (+) Transcript_93685:167-2242(+)
MSSPATQAARRISTADKVDTAGTSIRRKILGGNIGTKTRLFDEAPTAPEDGSPSRPRRRASIGSVRAELLDGLLPPSTQFERQISPEVGALVASVASSAPVFTEEFRANRRKAQAAFLSKLPPERKQGKVSFLRKAWQQARQSVLESRADEKADDSKAKTGWGVAKAVMIGTSNALKNRESLIEAVRAAALENYTRHRIHQQMVSEVEAAMAFSLCSVTPEMETGIMDILVAVKELAIMDLKEVGGLITDAVVNIHDVGESMTYLRDCLLNRLMELEGNNNLVNSIDFEEIQSKMDGIMSDVLRLKQGLAAAAMTPAGHVPIVRPATRLTTPRLIPKTETEQPLSSSKSIKTAGWHQLGRCLPKLKSGSSLGSRPDSSLSAHGQQPSLKEDSFRPSSSNSIKGSFKPSRVDSLSGGDQCSSLRTISFANLYGQLTKETDEEDDSPASSRASTPLHFSEEGDEALLPLVRGKSLTVKDMSSIGTSPRVANFVKKPMFAATRSHQGRQQQSSATTAEAKVAPWEDQLDGIDEDILQNRKHWDHMVPSMPFSPAKTKRPAPWLLLPPSPHAPSSPRYPKALESLGCDLPRVLSPPPTPRALEPLGWAVSLNRPRLVTVAAIRTFPNIRWVEAKPSRESQPQELGHQFSIGQESVASSGMSRQMGSSQMLIPIKATKSPRWDDEDMPVPANLRGG